MSGGASPAHQKAREGDEPGTFVVLCPRARPMDHAGAHRARGHPLRLCR